jgi:2-polyprenyl-6-methoxyphenol hydroxylase-like FAD-dependent oxidoreductase
MAVNLAQVETEELLRQKLKELGGSISMGAKVTDVTDDGEKVQLQVSTADTKTAITASYVVAADGIHSTIRESLGIAFVGGDYSASLTTTDSKFSSDGPLDPHKLHQYLSPDGFLLLIPLPQGIWRMTATMDAAPKEQDVAMYQRLADERGPTGIKVQELVWHSRFQVHHRLASQYRKGRAILAGDAAHCHSPAGGQGMNTGIQDGVRLGEILSEAVLEAKSSDADLDRYEKERRPVAAGVVALTHRITTMATMRSPWLGVLRNWGLWMVMCIPFVRRAVTYRLAELDH